MAIETIAINPSVNLSLDLPGKIATNLAGAVTIAITGIATAIVREGASVVSAVVKVVEEEKIKISLYKERGIYFREYIIPTIALYDAVQGARNYIYSSKWDDDLRLMALEDVNKILQKYRVR